MTGNTSSTRFSTCIARHGPVPERARWWPGLTSRLPDWVRSGARRVVPALRALHLTPNILTMLGLVICAGSAVLIALGFLLPGGLLLLVASGFDILTGALARVSGREHPSGAFLDSTVDRYAEAMTSIALLYYFLFLHGHHTLEP